MINIKNLTIKSTTDLLHKKETTAKELISLFLKEAKEKNKLLNNFITITEEEAINQANKVDNLILKGQALGSLAGIPIAIKDNFSTKGIKTTAASKILEDYVPPYNATVVEKLEEANTIIIGKSNMDAWAHGSSGENSDFGSTKNPYDLTRVPGGSSSGSAVSVSSGVVLASTGTDTGGSIRLPASFNNVVGLKPTYGLVSRYGIIAMASSLDSVGHITKTVYDSALFLNTSAGIDPKDSTSQDKREKDYTEGIENGVKNLKIGIPKEYINGLDPKILSLLKETVKKLEKLGAQVEEVSLPNTKYGIATYYIIQPSEVSSNLARYDGIRFGKKREFFGSEAKRRIILGTYTLSSGYYDAYYLKAMKARRLIKNDFTNAFKNLDALIAPVSPTLPFKLGEKSTDPLEMYLSDIYTVNVNLAGIPSLAVPAGFIEELPVGFQIIGPDFSEKLLFQIGHALEEENKLYLKTPKNL